MPPAPRPLAERFWEKVRKSDHCWIWIAGRDPHGYGRFNIGNKPIKAPRVAWELTYGPIPKGNGYHGTVVMHKCDNPACVRPDHLRLGTQIANLIDMKEKKRNPQGERHSVIMRNRAARGEAHVNSRLTKEQVSQIRASPGLYREIAERFGISDRHVSKIKRGTIWREDV